MHVAPFTGAWIEIGEKIKLSGFGNVAPFTGAWIEISISRNVVSVSRVALFTGAWIEIPPTSHAGTWYRCRSLHGSVD